MTKIGEMMDKKTIPTKNVGIVFGTNMLAYKYHTQVVFSGRCCSLSRPAHINLQKMQITWVSEEAVADVFVAVGAVAQPADGEAAHNSVYADTHGASAAVEAVDSGGAIVVYTGIAAVEAAQVGDRHTQAVRPQRHLLQRRVLPRRRRAAGSRSFRP